ncbi:MAG: hypothetical protein Q4P34_06830 [Tissierellia bacterium]|nr:hypothetical protein [Tissierellia bacterium]
MKDRVKRLLPYFILTALFVLFAMLMNGREAGENLSEFIVFLPVIFKILLLAMGIVYGIKNGFDILLSIGIAIIILPVFKNIDIGSKEIRYIFLLLIDWIKYVIIGNLIGYLISKYLFKDKLGMNG